ncbi:MAG: tetratricopeptide repeat-containing diguanylate cyclase [Lachnospiraceae bacterium]|nr:tetratricopeptide repeat-containing diguanylate cyclase [Lachnospiraceae bacterium]
MTKKELLNKITENRFGDVELQTQLCDELYEIAKEESERNLMGAALFYKGEILFAEDQNKAEKFLKRSLKYLNVEESSELVARANNVLGLIASLKEDFSEALNYHLSCMKICDEYGHKYVKAMSSCNIAVLFQMLGSYEEAVKYYEKSGVLFANDDSETAIANIASIYTNIFSCLYKLKDVQGMGNTLAKIKAYKEYVSPVFLIDLYEAIYDAVLENAENIDSKIDKAVAESLKEENVLDNLDNYQLLCEFLIENNRIDLLGRILDLIESNVSDKVFPKMRINFVKYRMLYYKQTGNTESLIQKSFEYVALYEKITSIYHESITKALNLRLYIDELKEKEDLYKKDAMTDNLTDLFNINGLDEKSQLLIDEAKSKSSTVASFIIDIDYFKQYNDYYGHVKGDECIKNVAKVIREACQGRGISARYGGDEFVIICADVSEKWVEKAASAIVQNVAALQLESFDSPISDYVSVSVGAYCGIISLDETLKSLIDKADKGLYQVKENGRNNYCIISSIRI